MKKQTIDFDKTKQFTPLFLDYISKNQVLKEFFSYPPSMEGFQEAIPFRNFSSEKRNILFNSLQNQYEELDITPPSNLEILKQKNTFTVCTGHQLNICTGPLYFIYKVMTAINLADTLNKQYKNYQFIPVYIMASEDHDFLEIAHFYLFDKKYQWDRETKNEPVGILDTDGLTELLDKIPDIPPVFKEAYGKKNLAHAMFYLVHHLFSAYQLIVLDPNKKALKNEFKEKIKEDILTHSFYPFLFSQTEKLRAMGYATQIHIREINFFYFHNQVRYRIEKTSKGYELVGGDTCFSKQEMESLITHYPERFSPNVALRPLYQETILPNIAYVGGPAEINYWLQLKTMFKKADTCFPILIPRHFALILSKKNTQLMDTWEMDTEDLFLEKNVLKKRIIEKNIPNRFELEKEKHTLDLLKKSTIEKTQKTVQGMDSYVLSRFVQIEKLMASIEYKIQKGQEKKHEELIQKFENFYQKNFPNGILQERVYNIMNFSINHPDFIEELKKQVSALEFIFNIYSIEEEKKPLLS